MALSHLNFFGLKITVFSKEELQNSAIVTIKGGMSKIYYGYSLAVLEYIKKYPNYLSVTSQYDIMVTDGRMFYLLARFFGFNLKYDISIPRLTLLLIELANKNNYSLMLFGGSDEANKKAVINLKLKYPGLNLQEGRNGFFKLQEEEGILNYISKNNPDILLIGLPTPYKQELALKLRSKLKSCIIVPCGGMIDVLAGKEKLTPIWIKKLGLASIYRHIQHPKRLPELFYIYLLTVKVFVLCFIKKYILRSSNINIPEIV